MRVELSIRPTIEADHARISARALTEELQQAVDALAGIGGDSTVVELQPGPRNAVVGTRGRSIVVVPVADVYIDAIDRIEPGFGGALSVQMVDGSVEWISRRFLGAFKQAIGMGRA